MIISIVAFDENKLIGASGSLVWEIKKDMMHFKNQTMGNICIMGRVTWESIPQKYRPLNGRLNIVVTSNENYEVPEGVLLAKDIKTALALTEDQDLMGDYFGKDTYICGGAQLYAAAMPYVDVLEVTEIAHRYPTDGLINPKYFPDIDWLEWYADISESHQTPEVLYFDFITYKRVVNAQLAA